MPEYLAPGVYVEETSFRAKSIEGVSTSTTGFVGPTRKGPVTGTPELITSFGDFERVYGGFADLEFPGRVTNYVGHAVRNYFDNGGARLYVARVYTASSSSDGVARSAFVGGDADDANNIRFVARTPGAGGNGQVTMDLITVAASQRSMDRAPQGTLLVDGTDVFVRRGTSWFDASNVVSSGSSGFESVTGISINSAASVRKLWSSSSSGACSSIHRAALS